MRATLGHIMCPYVCKCQKKNNKIAALLTTTAYPSGNGETEDTAQQTSR